MRARIRTRDKSMAEEVYLLWGDREEDDITKLPKHWDVCVAEDNRLFFLE